MKYSKYLKKGRKLLNLIREFIRQVIAGSLCRIFVKRQQAIDAGDFIRTDASSVQESPIHFEAASTENTDPQKFNMETGLFCDTEEIGSFARENPINFGPGSAYTSLRGIVTFRGNNYRDTASFGTANVEKGRLDTIWKMKTGRVLRSSATKKKGKSFWTGSGWTGQPLIIGWPDDIRNMMNIRPEKKANKNLVEVIYACMDGIIYFIDLKDGKPTRPPIKTGGGPIKGTASLYPDGTPMLFVGPADDPPGMDVVRARIYSLIDQKEIYSFGQKDSNSYRVYQSYDSSPLFDAKTDTIIEPGENGLLYTVKLNTRFDRDAGTLAVNPDKPVKLRYSTPDYKDGPKNTPTTRWLGMEDSGCIWKNFLYIADNGGKLMCIDLNTMQIKWVQDVLDDTNTSPVLEESPEDNACYLYISTSLHITAAGNGPQQHGGVPIWKINAATGEIVWQTPMYPCWRESNVSGGVQATPVLGKHDIADLVIYPVAHTPVFGSGALVALDKKTGREVWKTDFKNYCWSSPAAVYTPQGKSYIIQCDSDGNMFLIEGTTGKIVHHVYLWANIEASPAVFGNTVVVGTRRRKIYAVRIS